MPRHIVLLTDFGLADPYVGQMKGALFSHSPHALVVDLCHQIEPFNVLQAGFFLAASQAHFPDKTIFVAVVDPGVGGLRRIVLLETARKYFLAPDNGLLTLLLQDGGPALARDVTKVPRQQVAATFHGRDIFAPLAARLALGTDPRLLGAEVALESLVRAPGSEPARTPEGVRTAVLHVDRFGNCLLNLRCAFWAGPVFGAQSLTLAALGRAAGMVQPPAAYAQGPALAASTERPLIPVAAYEGLAPGSLGIIEGSQGYLELAMNKRSAAAELGFCPGDAVVILINSD